MSISLFSIWLNVYIWLHLMYVDFSFFFNISVHAYLSASLCVCVYMCLYVCMCVFGAGESQPSYALFSINCHREENKNSLTFSKLPLCSLGACSVLNRAHGHYSVSLFWLFSAPSLYNDLCHFMVIGALNYGI